MAWPIDARYQTFRYGTPVSPDFLNSLQDGVLGVIGGGQSIKRLQIDGIGNQASNAQSNQLCFVQKSSSPEDIATVVWRDGNLSKRLVIDKLGFPSQYIQFADPWLNGSLVAGTSGVLTNNGNWKGQSTANWAPSANVVGSPGAAVRYVGDGGTASYMGNVMTFYATSVVASDTCYVSTNFPFSGCSPDGCVVGEFDVFLPSWTRNFTVKIGFTNSTGHAGVLSTAEKVAALWLNSSDTTWHFLNCDGGGTTTLTDTSTAGTASVADRVRIELYGSRTNYGSFARFWLNGVLFLETGTNIPSGTPLYFMMSTSATGSVSAGTGYGAFSVGTPILSYNRYKGAYSY